MAMRVCQLGMRKLLNQIKQLLLLMMQGVQKLECRFLDRVDMLSMLQWQLLCAWELLMRWLVGSVVEVLWLFGLQKLHEQRQLI